nr:MAG TPA: hypothetical protein [Caudoviricetes sp.]
MRRNVHLLSSDSGWHGTPFDESQTGCYAMSWRWSADKASFLLPKPDRLHKNVST